MNAEWKKKWIEALEGPYAGKKGQGRLVHDAKSKYCCLGVVCELQDAYWRSKFSGLAGGLTTSNIGVYAVNVGLTTEECLHLARVNDDYITWKPVIEVIRALPDDPPTPATT